MQPGRGAGSRPSGERQADLERFYGILSGLEARVGGKRRLSSCSASSGWPRRGVYFFFEDGEWRSESGMGPRVVRVGTHALAATSSTSIWQRLSQHRGVASSGGGNHRGSVFRLLVGSALIGSDPALALPTKRMIAASWTSSSGSSSAGGHRDHRPAVCGHEAAGSAQPPRTRWHGGEVRGGSRARPHRRRGSLCPAGRPLRRRPHLARPAHSVQPVGRQPPRPASRGRAVRARHLRGSRKKARDREDLHPFRGWGLVRGDFLTPDYDITFSASARGEDEYKRRRRGDRYADFCQLPAEGTDPLFFFGGKDYVPLFSRLTRSYPGPRVVFYNSDLAPDAPGCTLHRYPTTAKTNWHYGCARWFLETMATQGEPRGAQ